MRLEQLKYIIEIYHTHSLSQAAKNLSLSQPSLSTALAALEDEWGVQLFHRLTTGVIPTETGERIIPLVSVALGDLMHRLSSLTPQNAPTETIHIMAAPTVCSAVLPTVIADFNRHYPHISIYIAETRPEFFLDTLSTSSSHLIGINAYEQAVESTYRLHAETLDFIIDPLYTDYFVCCFPSDSPLKTLTNITQEHLLKETAINFNSILDGPRYPFCLTTFPSEIYQCSQTIGVDSLESLKKLVADGAGASIIPRCALYNDPYVQTGKIIMRPYEENRMAFQHHLLISQQHRLSPPEEDFIQRLKAQYQTIDAYFNSTT